MASPCLRWSVKTRCGSAEHSGGLSAMERGEVRYPYYEAKKRTEERGVHRSRPPEAVAIAEAVQKLPSEARVGLEIARRILPCKQFCWRLKSV